MAVYFGSSKITQRKSTHGERVTLVFLMTKLILTIAMIDGHYWDEENSDENEHLAHLFEYIKI
jgi:hypothetical protein